MIPIRLLGFTIAAILVVANPGLSAAAGSDHEKTARADQLFAVAGEKMRAGQSAEARASLADALILYQKAEDLQGEASCVLLVGLIDAAAGDERSALANLEKSLSLLEAQGDRFSAWMVQAMLAELNKMEGRTEAALGGYERALGLLEQIEASTEPMRLAGFARLGKAFGFPAAQLEMLDSPLMELIGKSLFLRYAEAMTRIGFGGALIDAGKLPEAETQLDKAAALSRLFSGMFDTQIELYRGDLHQRRWHLAKAKESYLKALEGLGREPVIPGLPNPRTDIRVLSRVAEIESLSGHLDQALSWNDRVLAAVRTREDRKREAAALQDRAELLLRGGRPGDAEAVLNEALSLARESDDSYRQATIYADLGNVAMLRGSYQAAAKHLEQASKLLGKIDEPYVAAGARTILSEVYLMMESPGSASGVIERAKRDARESGFKLAEALADAVAAWARFSSNQGDLTEARERFEAFWKLAEADGLPYGEDVRELFHLILQLHGAPGQNAGSMPTADPSVPPNPRRFPFVPPLSKLMVGKQHLERGDAAQARELWLHALEEVRKLGNIDLTACLTAAVGVTYWKEGNAAEAIRFFREAVDLLGEVVTSLRVEELLTSYLGSGRRWFYEILIDLLVREGQLVEAFEVAERARSRAFLQMIGNRRLNPARGADPDLLAEAEALRSAIATWQRRGERTNDLQNARQSYTQLLVRLKVSNPEYTSLVTVEPVRLADVQREIPAETTLISYFLKATGAHAWVVDRETFKYVPLVLDRKDFQQVVCWSGKVARPRGGRRPDDPCAQETDLPGDLFKRLFAPLREHIHHRRLIVIPHGELHYLPFAALRDPKTDRYLIEDYTLTYAPSASVLGFLRAKETIVSGKALVLGAPEEGDSSLSHLPGAQAEAEVVGRLFGSRPVLGAKATESRLHQLKGEIDLLHIAAHGTYEPRNPLFSHIAFAPDKEHDGNLEVHEVFSSLDLTGVNLVVLSACETALGERSGGDEITGLTRAFLYAGAPAVLSTLWKIDDKASAILIQDFYRRLLDGAPAAEALRQAQLSLRRNPRYEHPYFWAAFSLTGDPQATWRPRAERENER